MLAGRGLGRISPLPELVLGVPPTPSPPRPSPQKEHQQVDFMQTHLPSEFCLPRGSCKCSLALHVHILAASAYTHKLERQLQYSWRTRSGKERSHIHESYLCFSHKGNVASAYRKPLAPPLPFRALGLLSPLRLFRFLELSPTQGHRNSPSSSSCHSSFSASGSSSPLLLVPFLALAPFCFSHFLRTPPSLFPIYVSFPWSNSEFRRRWWVTGPLNRALAQAPCTSFDSIFAPLPLQSGIRRFVEPCRCAPSPLQFGTRWSRGAVQRCECV